MLFLNHRSCLRGGSSGRRPCAAHSQLQCCLARHSHTHIPQTWPNTSWNNVVSIWGAQVCDTAAQPQLLRLVNYIRDNSFICKRQHTKSNQIKMDASLTWWSLVHSWTLFSQNYVFHVNTKFYNRFHPLEDRKTPTLQEECNMGISRLLLFFTSEAYFQPVAADGPRPQQICIMDACTFWHECFSRLDHNKECR